MSQDRDPFELLPRFVDPEPDPVVMEAIIAQSGDAFRRQGSSRQSRPASWWDWLRQSGHWLMPAGAGALALAVAVVMVPGLLNTAPPADMERERVAEAPAAPPPAQSAPTTLSRGNDPVADAPPSDTSVRMGMQPGPGQAPSDPPPKLVSVFEGNDIRIGSRLGGSELELYLPDISGEQTIDSQGLVPGEEVEILGAFRLPERDIVAIRLRVDDARFWRIYRPVDGAYTRDIDLSRLVTDAADQAEVERLLPAD